MRNVLIVDDSQSDRNLASKVVLSCGFRAYGASSGEEAIAILKKGKPDLILLDVVMPEMDGFKTCRLIKKNPDFKDVPVILVTSKNTPSDQFWGKKQGADGHLPKPYTPIQLEEIILKNIR